MTTTLATRRGLATSAESLPVPDALRPDPGRQASVVQCRLPRHGKPDLFFSGALLGTAREQFEQTAPMRNWWEITLYRTSVGAYLLSSTYHVVEEGDRTLSTVISFCEAQCVRDFFETNAAPVSGLARHILQQAASKDSTLRAALAGVLPQA